MIALVQEVLRADSGLELKKFYTKMIKVDIQ